MVLQNETNDEIHAYRNCRFICSYEDVWCLFQFPIYSRTPTIERLQGHIFAFSAKCYLLKQQLSLSCS
jgi:hypothetical protein